MESIMCNLGAKPTSPRSHSYDFYLDKIKELGLAFGKLEAVCTDGDIRPPYRYQWRATTIPRPGDDDPFEGLGGNPLDALRDCYVQAKYFIENPPDEEDDEEEALKPI